MVPSRRLARTLALASLIVPAAAAQEWPHVGGDAGSTKHSPLDQIHRENVGRLEVAWTFDSGEASAISELQITPLLLNDRLYVASPRHIAGRWAARRLARLLRWSGGPRRSLCTSC